MHYILDLSVGSQYPQIQKMTTGYDFNGPHSVSTLARYYQELPNFTPDLDGFILQGQTKLTDFISCVFTGPWGFIVSEKVKSILEDLELPMHAFYGIKLLHRKKEIGGYYWLHIVGDLVDIIDFPASKFVVTKDYSYDLGEVEILSKGDLLEKKARLKERNKGHNISVGAKRIRLTNHIKYDLFDVGIVDNNHYISERLKTAFVESGVSGINIKPLSWDFY